VTTAIEHHAVLEPMGELARRGFTVERVKPDRSGAIDAASVRRAVRADTLLVSVMHVNNETGVIQPIDEVATSLADSDALFQVDAAQSFGKELHTLKNPRIDLISISGHKIHAPKGVGALVVRRRNGRRPPLTPLTFGGGQERGWRPGTLPVALIAAFGKAAELAVLDYDARSLRCGELRRELLDGLAPLSPIINGDANRTLPNIVNITIPGVDAETAIDAWRDLAAVSHGAACTSQSYTCSHVLDAMGVPPWREEGALRLSWCHLTPTPDVAGMVAAIEAVRRSKELASR
jgi:cysteine desulfurase